MITKLNAARKHYHFIHHTNKPAFLSDKRTLIAYNEHMQQAKYTKPTGRAIILDRTKFLASTHSFVECSIVNYHKVVVKALTWDYSVVFFSSLNACESVCLLASWSPTLLHIICMVEWIEDRKMCRWIFFRMDWIIFGFVKGAALILQTFEPNEWIRYCRKRLVMSIKYCYCTICVRRIE